MIFALRHEIGGSLGVAVLVTIATAATGSAGARASAAGVAAGLGHAYLAAGVVAATSGLLALVILPSARSFLPRLRLAPSMPIH